MPIQSSPDDDHSIRLKVGYNGDILIIQVNNSIPYPDFCEEIKDICKFDDKQPFTVKWVDEEGDPCTISSQMELNEAIRLYEVNKDSEINMHENVRWEIFGLLPNTSPPKHWKNADSPLKKETKTNIRPQTKSTLSSSTIMKIFPNVPERPGMPCIGEDRNMYRRGARRWRKLYKVNGHLFQAKRFSRRAFCRYCNDRIWGLGRQGYKCIQCKLLVHKKCHKLIKNVCGEVIVGNFDAQASPPPGYTKVTAESPDSNRGSPRRNITIEVGKEVESDSDSDYTETSRVEASSNGDEGSVTVEDFELLRVIGRGSYAKVMMVEHKRTKRIYAMKVIKKELFNDDDDIDWVQTEKHVFETATNYPFLVGLHSCFQSLSRLFFVIEFVNGGDLMFHMQRQRKLHEEHARFYAAEIILALHFLHERGIVYRDLKLDNVLLDAEGHIKLTDYGMCKEGLLNGELTNTFCGTPNYIAPEVLRGEEYDFSVDWWALGVLMFEMLAGRSPFDVVGGAEHPDQNTEDYLFQIILDKAIRIPRSLSVKAASILKGFLNKNPKERLGCDPVAGFSDIQSHQFFRAVDWDLLEQKQLTPPYKPAIKSDRDLEHFDPAFTKEPVQLTPDDRHVIEKIDQSEFEGFEYVNPLLMSLEDCV